ncbi:sulfurtransferase TusA family protein [Synechococcus elongatus]|uniref:UPF0033 domain-containing protein n=2 Tax=Synechococcus elongatus TaxID=32046 RepID=Q31LG4_SYNE7|nr:sulfurtransferase TusA family protein [Synechococcus elongatus]ABB58105.1 conserved hypothetical protein [Synechococcus elongatus PCC 7942 = FACHB-805]AJD57419.1 hypothetical protein M744_06015 [Synechococcus elongatus UTEX 2973]MBD2586824.1 sulfurtransferase TusA family protein [Synechococcus elongatus FACHB-242]MBD2687895.1 sulfurtransferase TusA family protein [Synechococcus elongatus FACHB-1061]MBD2706394.1 sulfurtransferase TusA family protein [Synechococcus elongatus PCC 7942 = FACHB-
MSQPDDRLDLRGIVCPINFVRTKLKLEQMPAGSLLEVWLDAGEPVEQVPDSLRLEGYEVALLPPETEQPHRRLWVRSPEQPTA